MTQTSGDVTGTADSARNGLMRYVRPSARIRWVIAAQCAMMLMLSILYPPFQQPDEAAHVDYVVAHRHGVWFAGPGERAYQSGIIAADGLVPPAQYATHVGSKRPLERSARPSFDELGTAPSTSFIKDQMVQHPPLYYGLAAGFTYLLPHFDKQRFDVQIYWLRLFSLLLLLPVPLIIYRSIRSLFGSETVALLAAMLPMSMPVYLRTGAAVTNDALLILLTTVLMGLLARIAWGDHSWRTAQLTGLVWGAALLTKGFAIPLAVAIVVSYLVGASGSLLARVRQAFWPACLAGGVGAAIGGWWWIRNFVVYHSVQPNGYGPLTDAQRQFLTGRDRDDGTELKLFTAFFTALGRRMWGSLGFIDVPHLPYWLLFAPSVVLLLTLVGCFALAPRLAGQSRARIFALLAPAGLTVMLMYAGTRSTYLSTGQLSGVQARYVSGTLLGVAGCSAAVWVRLLGERVPKLMTVAFAATIGFVTLSAYRVVDVELSAPSSDRIARLKSGLRYAIGWAPWPAVVTALLAAVCVTVVVVGFAVVWRGEDDTAGRTRALRPAVS